MSPGASTIFDVCGITDPPFSTPGEWPPDGDSDVSKFTGYGGLSPTVWPHASGIPPFYAMCSNFGFYNETITSQAAYIPQTIMDDLVLIGELFSNVLRMSYFAPGLSSEYVNSMESAFVQQYLELAPALTEASTYLSGSSVKTVQGMQDTLLVSLNGHINSAKSTAQPSSATIRNFAMLPFAPANVRLYPEYFQYCQSSQQLWDYLLQIPNMLYPGVIEDDPRMLRCSPYGLKMLEVEVDILRWEYTNVCPTNAELRARVDEFTRILREGSDMFMGKSTRIGAGSTALNEPMTGHTYLIPGMDADYIRGTWFAFLHTHVTNALSVACGTTYVVSDVLGYTTRDMPLTGAPSDFDAIQSAWVAQFPYASPSDWINPFPLCPEYGYQRVTFPCTAIPRSGCNDVIVQPHESPCTLANYSGTARRSNYTLYYGAQIPELDVYEFANDTACEYDPLGRILNSKFGFDLQTDCGTNPRCSIVSQLHTFGGFDFDNASQVATFCGESLFQFFGEDNFQVLTPPWAYDLAFEYLIGPACPRCNPSPPPPMR